MECKRYNGFKKEKSTKKAASPVSNIDNQINEGNEISNDQKNDEETNKEEESAIVIESSNENDDEEMDETAEQQKEKAKRDDPDFDPPHQEHQTNKEQVKHPKKKAKHHDPYVDQPNQERQTKKGQGKWKQSQSKNQKLVSNTAAAQVIYANSPLLSESVSLVEKLLTSVQGHENRKNLNQLTENLDELMKNKKKLISWAKHVAEGGDN